jgi:hypothetical protein
VFAFKGTVVEDRKTKQTAVVHPASSNLKTASQPAVVHPASSNLETASESSDLRTTTRLLPPHPSSKRSNSAPATDSETLLEPFNNLAVPLTDSETLLEPFNNLAVPLTDSETLLEPLNKLSVSTDSETVSEPFSNLAVPLTDRETLSEPSNNLSVPSTVDFQLPLARREQKCDSKSLCKALQSQEAPSISDAELKFGASRKGFGASAVYQGPCKNEQTTETESISHAAATIHKTTEVRIELKISEQPLDDADAQQVQ